MLDAAEEEELNGLQGFVEIIGVTEMQDKDFARYMELLEKRKPCAVETSSAEDRTQFTICAEHVAEGWFWLKRTVPVWDWDKKVFGRRPPQQKDENDQLVYKTIDAVDKTVINPCGCIVSSLWQHSISKCPTHQVGPMACCPKAKTFNCVCAYSYTCPVHGEQHHGTHE